MKLPLSLAEAPTDVLVYLVDHPGGHTREDIVEAMVTHVGLDELTREDITRVTARGLRLLHELEFVSFSGGGEMPLRWDSTTAGREVVADARAKETPDAA